jgi:AcrR family transcriptional regulator
MTETPDPVRELPVARPAGEEAALGPVVELAPRAAGDEDSARAIERAALEMFAEHGYDGTTLRGIARRAGISPAGVYHHFPAKIDILFSLIWHSLRRMVGSTDRAVAAAGARPLDRLRAAVRAHVAYHVDYQLEAFVGLTELRTFRGERLAAIVELRRHQQRVFDEIVARIAEGNPRIEYPDEVSRAIVTMGMSVANWYRHGGALTRTQVLERYEHLATVLVAADQD